MQLCDKIVKKIHKVEAIRAEIDNLDRLLLKEDYRDEEHEDDLRMRKVVKQGQVEIIKSEIKKEFTRWVRQ